MRAVRTLFLTALVIIGAAVIAFFIVAEKFRRVIDRLINGPDI